MELGGIGNARSVADVASHTRGERVFSQAAQRLTYREDADALREAAIEFESLFINHLLSTMRRTIPKSELFGETSFARETFEGMFDEELAKVMARAGGIGLADMLMRQLGQAVYDPKK